MKAIGNRNLRMGLVGASAALCAAFPLGLILSLPLSRGPTSLLFGSILGGTIAGFLTAFEQLWTQMRDRFFYRILASGSLGALGGAAGAYLGQTSFAALGQHLVGGSATGIAVPLSLGAGAGWALTGIGVGTAITLPFSSRRSRWLLTAAGGAAGGALGGIIMQLFRPMMGQASLVFGLIALGVAMGFGISWTERVLSSVRLQILEGPGRGSELPIGRSTLIGSHGSCPVRLTEAGVAPKHARIVVRSSGPVIEDMGSPLGSRVNDRKISGTSARLTHGDLIRIGRSLFRVSAAGLKTGRAATVLCLAVLVLAGPVSIPGNACADDNEQARITQIDASGFPVVDLYASLPGSLRPGRFHTMEVSEGGREALLLEVRDLKRGTRDVPLTISIVVDTSRSMTGAKLQEAKDAIFRFTQSIHPSARVNLISFSDKVRVIAEGIPASMLYREVSELKAGGHTALFDAIRSGTALLENQPGRRVVITLTDGMANRGIVSMDEALLAAQDGGVSLLFVGLGPDARRNRLETMAGKTGGTSVYTSNPSDLARLFEAFADDISREVLIRYRSPLTAAAAVPVALNLSSGSGELSIEGAYFSPRASFYGTSGARSPVLLLLALLGPAGLFAAGRLTKYNLSRDPVLLVEGSSQATRMITRVLAEGGGTVPMTIGGETVLVNNQPVKGTRTLRPGETLTWGDTTILHRG
ncbi:MAG: VWA domain-containing protein [bacterium]|nr:MAG: VWA domain-containing protein [bacterium]